MKLYEFTLLDIEDQLEITFSDGEYVDMRYQGNHRILLYQVSSFYVEVFYDGEKDMIVKHRSFSPLTQLEPYLREISLAGII